jgi:hypothetical protein
LRVTILSGSCVARAFLPLAFLLSGCSQGGNVSIPASEVPVTGEYDLLSFRSLPGFGPFPVKESSVSFSKSLMLMDANGNYTNFPRPQGTTTFPSYTSRYGVTTLGALAIYQESNSRESTLVFRGGIDFAGEVTASTSIFFTDRISAGGSLSIGPYYGSKVFPVQAPPTQPNVSGDWHVMSLHVILAPSSAIPTAQNVGRAMHGSVSIGAAPAGNITGGPNNATQSAAGNVAPPQAPISLSGAMTYDADPQNPGGRFTGTLNYGGDDRAFDAVAGGATAANPGCIFALCSNPSIDRSAGMILFVQKFAAPVVPPVTTSPPADPLLMAGTYLIGGQTLFIVPTNAGSDTFVGTMVLSVPVAGAGTFRLTGQSHLGTDFSYTGSYRATTHTLQPPDPTAYDGGITLTVNGFNETWFAAISRDYQTMVLVDDWPETRAIPVRELSLSIGTRQKTPPPPPPPPPADGR